MKRLIFVCALLCAALFSFAEDVIVTATGERLSVKITAVSHDAVTYKMADYLDGPDFTIQSTAIDSIYFGNGQVKAYNHAQYTNTATTSTHTSTAKSTETTTASSAVVTTTTRTNYTMDTDGNSYFRNGIRMSNKAYAEFLENTCPQAYDTYKSGLITEATGWALFCIGIPLSTAGIVMSVVGSDPYATIGVCSAGLAFDIACIPCLVVGVVKTKRSAQVYNAYCGKPTAATLKMTSGPNGLGLALAF